MILKGHHPAASSHSGFCPTGRRSCHAVAVGLLLATLTGCGGGSAPVVGDPPRLKAALEAESDGAKRYQRGDYGLAARRFTEATRLFASIDDRVGLERNRLHSASADLALGQSESALRTLSEAAAEASIERPIDLLMLKAQAQLALAGAPAAVQSLAAAAVLCGETCPQRPSLHLLDARAALAGGRPAPALAYAEAALALLQGKDEAAEIGNAWRLIAAARLAGNDPTAALPAAQRALDIDRRLALPAKITSDWLLIGDIENKTGRHDAASAAWRRALDVAVAAELGDAVKMAQGRLAEAAKAKGAPR